MAEIRPFRGVRPRPDLAVAIVAPPYDVLSEDEARAIARRDGRSFIRVTRPEVNLPEGSDPHDARAYAAGAQRFEQMLAEHLLEQDDAPCLYFYGQQMGAHRQVALMALCSVAEYDDGRIRKHELTRPDKEQDRVDHIHALGAQTGLVFLTCRRDPALSARLRAARPARPLFEVTTDDGVIHTLWKVDDPATISGLTEAFSKVERLYIADGHHRSAAASRVNAALGGQGPHNWFLAGIFTEDELQVLAYNRLVHDLNGHSPAALREALSRDFELSHADSAEPPERGTFTMYLEGRWWLLRPRPGVVNADDPVASLDVAVLQDRVLGPLLGIADPRRSTRISFVGGIRGTAALAAAVDRGEAAVAFALAPTGLDQLFAVADADQIMPPKSTWFEPKLRGGVLIHRF